MGESPGKVGIVTPERSNLEFDEPQKDDLDLQFPDDIENNSDLRNNDAQMNENSDFSTAQPHLVKNFSEDV